MNCTQENLPECPQGVKFDNDFIKWINSINSREYTLTNLPIKVGRIEAKRTGLTIDEEGHVDLIDDVCVDFTHYPTCADSIQVINFALPTFVFAGPIADNQNDFQASLRATVKISGASTSPPSGVDTNGAYFVTRNTMDVSIGGTTVPNGTDADDGESQTSASSRWVSVQADGLNPITFTVCVRLTLVREANVDEAEIADHATIQVFEKVNYAGN